MKKSIVFLLSIYSIFLQAQDSKSINNQDMIWYAYYNTLQFSEKTYLTSELQERHFVNPIAQHQIVFRTHIHQEIDKNREVSAGFCFFFHGKNDPDQPQTATVPEFRPHVEFGVKQPFQKFVLSHRYRAELRYFHNVSADRLELEDGYKFTHCRIRYQLQASTKLGAIQNKIVRLRVFDEIMLNAGKKVINNVFDQNNIYAGLSIEINPNTQFEIGILKRFQQRANPNEYFERDILRLTLFHKIKLY